MQAVMQVKMAMDKAQKLGARLEELRTTAARERLAFEKALMAAKSEKEEARIRAALEEAREAELGLNMSTLLRAIIDEGMAKFFSLSEGKQLSALAASRVHIGRPVQRAKSGVEAADNDSGPTE